MDSQSRKAINFDLDTVKMREIDLYPKGYQLLKHSFKIEGFIHRQGSGYVSKEKLSNNEVRKTIRNIVRRNPWLADCVRKIDVTDIGRQHDLTAIVRDIGEQVNQSRESEEPRAFEAESEKKKGM